MPLISSKTLTHGELFAGISGFGLGFSQADIETVWHVEIDKKCQDVLRRHYPNCLILSDIKDCGVRNLPPVDIISFGSPCQDLSVAGKRGGLSGQRSGLFYEAIRIVDELKPALAVWENVPGAFSSNSGRDFTAVLLAFQDIGARDIAWTCLDAQYFGVAQRRRRIFLAADFTGNRAAEILFESESLSWDTAPSRETGARIAAPLTRGSAAGSGVSDPGRRCEDDVNLIAAQCHGGNVGPMGTLRKGDGGLTSGVPFIVNALQSGKGGPDDNDAQGGHLVIDPLTASPHADNEAQHRKLVVAYNWQSGGDVRLSFGKPNLHCGQVPAVGVRRLTPTECERLQGFPDGWTAWGLDKNGERVEMSDSARYRMLGNAVATVQAEWIGRQILRLEDYL